MVFAHAKFRSSSQYQVEQLSHICIREYSYARTPQSWKQFPSSSSSRRAGDEQVGDLPPEITNSRGYSGQVANILTKGVVTVVKPAPPPPPVSLHQLINVHVLYCVGTAGMHTILTAYCCVHTYIRTVMPVARMHMNTYVHAYTCSHCVLTSINARMH
jgi:hypothetical protein